MPWTVKRWAEIPGLQQSFGGRGDRVADRVLTLRQVHGSTVRFVGEVRAAEMEGDGLVADRAGAAVGVWTADCVPIHLVAPDARIAAAVHAGWRGTVAGIADVVVEAVQSRFDITARDLEAALGPAIGACCYEVGEEVAGAFRSRYGADGAAGFERRGNRLFLDLRTFLAARLRALGVARVERIGPCTACRTDLLYSYRKEGKTGRQLSAIGWR
jgi:hypothetical protein